MTGGAGTGFAAGAVATIDTDAWTGEPLEGAPPGFVGEVAACPWVGFCRSSPAARASASRSFRYPRFWTQKLEVLMTLVPLLPRAWTRSLTAGAAVPRASADRVS